MTLTLQFNQGAINPDMKMKILNIKNITNKGSLCLQGPQCLRPHDPRSLKPERLKPVAHPDAACVAPLLGVEPPRPPLSDRELPAKCSDPPGDELTKWQIGGGAADSQTNNKTRYSWPT